MLNVLIQIHSSGLFRIDCNMFMNVKGICVFVNVRCWMGVRENIREILE